MKKSLLKFLIPFSILMMIAVFATSSQATGKMKTGTTTVFQLQANDTALPACSTAVVSTENTMTEMVIASKQVEVACVGQIVKAKMLSDETTQGKSIVVNGKMANEATITAKANLTGTEGKSEDLVLYGLAMKSMNGITANTANNLSGKTTMNFADQIQAYAMRVSPANMLMNLATLTVATITHVSTVCTSSTATIVATLTLCGTEAAAIAQAII